MISRSFEIKEKPKYYTITPAEIRYDNNLCSSAKLLYGEIVCLCAKEGKCWASNSFFARIYGVKNSTVSRWIKKLKDKYINIEYLYKGKSCEKRIITLTKEAIAINQQVLHKNNKPIAKMQQGYCKKGKDSNTRYNNTSEYEISEKLPLKVNTVEDSQALEFEDQICLDRLKESLRTSESPPTVEQFLKANARWNFPRNRNKAFDMIKAFHK